MIEIELFFNELGILKQDSGKWYNGETYFPYSCYKCKVKSNSDLFDINIEYDYLQNQFVNKDVLGDDSGLDRHIVKIKAIISQRNINSSFEVSSVSFIGRLFGQKKIKADNLKVQSFLENSKSLNQIFKISKNSSHFDPVINGEIINKEYRLLINYNTASFNPEIITVFLQFVNELRHLEC